MKFSVIETGGKQYKVSVDDVVRVEKIEGKEGDEVELDKVLLKSDDGKISLGKPYLEGQFVKGEILSQERDEKKIVFKYKRRARHRRKKGHKQPLTKIKITSV